VSNFFIYAAAWRVAIRETTDIAITYTIREEKKKKTKQIARAL